MDSSNKRKRETTIIDRKAIFALLLMHCKDGELERGSFVSVANAFEVCKDTVRQIWCTVLSNMEAHLASQEDIKTQLLLDALLLPISREKGRGNQCAISDQKLKPAIIVVKL
jgi:hypothetical protein